MSMEIKYIPDNEFTPYVRSREWRIDNIVGSMRWIIKEDGVEYIARPESARPHDSDPE